MRPTTRILAAIGTCLAIHPWAGRADSSYLINNTTADAFLAAGSPGNPLGANLTTLNFGGAGTLAIAPASSVKGEFDSIIKFNSAGAVSQFNSTYGPGSWKITGFTLSLASNFGGQGEQPNLNALNTINAGSFGIDWLGYDAWVEGNGGGMGTPGYPAANNFVTFQSISTLFSAGSSSLGTYAYNPPGDNIYVSYSLPVDSSFAADAAAGGDISLYFYAADNEVSYLFNARSFGSNHPELDITATAAPEPWTMALLGPGFAGPLVLRSWKRRK